MSGKKAGKEFRKNLICMETVLNPVFPLILVLLLSFLGMIVAMVVFSIKYNYDDINPGQRGEWLICSDGYYPYCSECRHEPPHGEMTNYCPQCGAKMDKEESNEVKN